MLRTPRRAAADRTQPQDSGAIENTAPQMVKIEVSSRTVRNAGKQQKLQSRCHHFVKTVKTRFVQFAHKPLAGQNPLLAFCRHDSDLPSLIRLECGVNLGPRPSLFWDADVVMLAHV